MMRQHHRQHRSIPVIVMLGLISAYAWACDTRDEPVDPDVIWGSTAIESTVQEPIMYRERTANDRYGLPREGNSSIADLIAVFGRTQMGESEDQNLFIATGEDVPTDQCLFGASQGAPAFRDDLPMTIEGVVTLHPRRYAKVGVCGQDERNYGTFTVEDDTGGIMVLRNSRVAPYTYGDRVRLTVRGLMRTFGPNPATRAVLIADIEPAGKVENGQLLDPVVYYENQTRSFAERTIDSVGAVHDTDIGEVKRVEGYVHVVPTNNNFNALVMTNVLIPQDAGDDLEVEEEGSCGRICVERCGRVCGDDNADREDLRNDEIRTACIDICGNGVCADNMFDVAELPACWLVSVDADLGRRGLELSTGQTIDDVQAAEQRLRVTGPVVSAFGTQLWVMSLGQFEVVE